MVPNYSQYFNHIVSSLLILHNLVIGFTTSTNLKIIVAIEDDILPDEAHQQKVKDEEVKSVLVSNDVTIVDVFFKGADTLINVLYRQPFLLLHSFSFFLFRQSRLHSLYVNYLLNPFSKTTGRIVSKRFDKGVDALISDFNRP